MDVSEILARLGKGGKGRTEADIQSDIKLLLLAARFDLEDEQVELVSLESQVGDGSRRRIDIELGFTIIEVKKALVSDTQRAQLAGYLAARTEQTGGTYAGILTDGKTWELHRLTSSGEGDFGLAKVSSFVVDSSRVDVDRFVMWLESVLSTRQKIPPSPREIELRLGAESAGYQLDMALIGDLFERVKGDSEVALKRSLWAKSLESAFGTQFENTDELFISHTYLVAVAELVAHAATLGLKTAEEEPARLLDGTLFREAGIRGVVEADFFDWLSDAEVDGAREAGRRIVRSLARRVDRFDWDDLKHDVLKVLYESVISQETRHSLGEYYTPDWLAQEIVAEVVDDPNVQRVLDPSCGSGTFLFHTIRRKVTFGEAGAEQFNMVVNTVFGMDLHPVAVTLARITYVLALRDILRFRSAAGFRVPVFLGDSLQWGRSDDDQTLLGSEGLRISTDVTKLNQEDTGAQGEMFAREMLFPMALVEDAESFDRIVSELVEKATGRARKSKPLPTIGKQFFNRHGIEDSRSQEEVVKSFEMLCDLHDHHQDHIWGYYIRNLARPLWLGREPNRVDVLVGNPPWLRYNAMTKPMQEEMKERCESHGMKLPAKLLTHSDLSAAFVVTATNLYLKAGGRFGFVMPRGALGGPHYKPFRAGAYPANVGPYVQFDEPWDLLDVRPHLFPVPSCVAFGSKTDKPSPMPDTALAWKGRLHPKANDVAKPREDLTRSTVGIVRADDGPQSPYHDEFKQGATFIPRSLTMVVDRDAGVAGVSHETRAVASRRGGDKKPWSELQDLKGAIEPQFVRPCYLGSSIAAFRVLGSESAVVPWDGTDVLTHGSAAIEGHHGLNDWWSKANERWDKHGKKTMSLDERLNYQALLGAQFPIPPTRIVYTTSGKRLTAAVIRDDRAVIDHKLYWARVETIDEGRYLAAVLNSASLLDRVTPLQSQGQFGPRDFHRYPLYPAIPRFDEGNERHQELVKLAEHAEAVAACVEGVDGAYFTTARTRVSDALAADGVQSSIDGVVAAALD